MRTKPPPGDYQVTVNGEIIILHVTEEGAWYEDPLGKMIHYFWLTIGEGGPILVSLTKGGAIFIGLNEDQTVDRIIYDNETGEQTVARGHYAPV